MRTAGVVRGQSSGYDVGIRKTGERASTIGLPASFILNPYNIGPSAVSNSGGASLAEAAPG